MNEMILGLLKCYKIGPVSVKKFFETFNYNEDKIKLEIFNYFKTTDDNIIKKNIELAKREIVLQQEKGINIINVFDDCFPKKIVNIDIPILYLYYKGDIEIINKKNITVIGTRNPSKESNEKVEAVCKFFVNRGYNIVSGMAKGIDTYAHLSCLKNKGKTIAVLPSDLENVKPSSNLNLSREISKSGCLISEYSVGTVLNKYNYAMRDRIESALSDIVIVIEATVESGTFLTVKSAIKNNRLVFWLNKPVDLKIKQIIDFDIEKQSLEIIEDEIIKNTYEQRTIFELEN